MVKDSINNLACEIEETLIEIRRELHRYPELGCEISKTRDLVCEYLKRWEIEYELIENQGIIAEIKGKKNDFDDIKFKDNKKISNSKEGESSSEYIEKEKKVVLLRADMDALCIDEKTNVDCKSTLKNRMHACGHDAHTSGMLGAGYILKKLENEFSGVVRLVFQPCEEDASGLNAKKLVDKGILLKDKNNLFIDKENLSNDEEELFDVNKKFLEDKEKLSNDKINLFNDELDLKNNRVDAAISTHVFTKIKSGKVGVKVGETTGVPGGFSIKIIGKQGHSSEPAKCIDSIMIMNQIYSMIQSVQRNNIDPDRASVISVTYMNAGNLDKWNIIPEISEMKGNIRTQYESDNKRIGLEIENIVKNICSIYGADYEYDYRMYVESVKNDEYISKLVSDSVFELTGEAAITPPFFMGGDDFCKISEEIPSCYFLVGIGKGENDHPIHSDKFELDEDSIILISKIMSLSTLKFMGENK